MSSADLQGCRVLVVEDEYMLAEDLRSDLDEAGAIVLGPVGKLKQALDLIGAEERIDGAVLDVNLGGEKVYPVADQLIRRGVPIIFTTGYDASAIPACYSQIARCEKPVNINKVAAAIGKLIHDK